MPDADRPDMIRTLIALTPRQHEWLRTRAFHARTSITGEIRDLVQEAIETEVGERSVTAPRPEVAR